MSTQNGILQDVPRIGRYDFFQLHPADAVQVQQCLLAVSPLVDGTHVVLGLGAALLQLLQARIPGMHTFNAQSGVGVAVPATPFDLVCWHRGDDSGALLHQSRAIAQALAPAFKLLHSVDAFSYSRGPNGMALDLTGYEDGLENPSGQAALSAATVHGMGVGLDGSSFMTVQQWQHDLDRFASMGSQQQDHTFGRSRSTQEELDDAPESAHVKRTAQEDFSPEAYVLRRSMAWSQGQQAGLVFVAFGRSLDAFEAQMQRMLGLDDGVVDALFSFTRPLTGTHFWCPPLRGQSLDWRALGMP